jgi:ribonuclease HII
MLTVSPYDWTHSIHTSSNTEFERQAAESGARAIAGVDEAGRGPLAGPIVAAAVILGAPIDGVDDSKRLTESQRESHFVEITGGTHAVGVAIVPPERIDEIGIQRANYQAMSQALDALKPQPDFALVDGFVIPGCVVPHCRIVKGDQRSCSIAAASVVAKVTRDRMLLTLDHAHPEYGFARHKGYATAEHLDALERLGPCPAHRRSFAPLAKRAETMDIFAEGDLTA